MEDVSANRSAAPEAAEGFTSADTTNFQVQVSGFNQATTGYVLRVAVTEFGDACPASSRPTTNVTFTGSGSTLVLYPESRFTSAGARHDRHGDRQTHDDVGNGNGGVTVGTVTTSGDDWTTQDRCLFGVRRQLGRRGRRARGSAIDQPSSPSST